MSLNTVFNQSIFHCRQLRMPAHHQRCTNPRRTRDHFAVEVCALQLYVINWNHTPFWHILIFMFSICSILCVCFRLQSSDWRRRRHMLLETRQKRTILWWMRLKKVRDFWSLWPLTSDILLYTLTEWTKLTMSLRFHILFFLLVSCFYSILFSSLLYIAAGKPQR